MNFSERLRRNMEEKGPEAVKKWSRQLEVTLIRKNTEEVITTLKGSKDAELTIEEE